MPVHQEGAVRPDLRAMDIAAATASKPRGRDVRPAARSIRGPSGIRLEEAAPPDVSGGALGSRLSRRWPCGRGTR